MGATDTQNTSAELVNAGVGELAGLEGACLVCGDWVVT